MKLGAPRQPEIAVSRGLAPLMAIAQQFGFETKPVPNPPLRKAAFCEAADSARRVLASPRVVGAGKTRLDAESGRPSGEGEPEFAAEVAPGGCAGRQTADFYFPSVSSYFLPISFLFVAHK